MRKIILIGILSWLLISPGRAQDSGVLIERISALMKEFPRLSIAVFFNQDRFIPGDSALIYAEVREPSGQIFTRRQVLHFELVNEDGKIAHRQHALLPTGRTETFLNFPATLKPGNYLLRSYTDYMKNFGPSSYFYREIELLAERSLRNAAGAAFINIYPEGGRVLGGVPVRIILSHHGIPLGSAVEFQGSVSGMLGKVFTGNANFSEAIIRPVSGERIVAIYANQIKSNTIDAQTEGMSLLMRRNGSPRITVFRNGASFRNEKKFSAVVFAGGKPLTLKHQFSSADSLIFLLPDNLFPGLNKFSVLDAEGNELLSRIFSGSLASNSSVVIPDKSVYTMRDTISLQSEIFDSIMDNNILRYWLSVTDSRAWRKPEQLMDPALHSTFLAAGFGEQHPDYKHNSDDDLWLSTIQENWLPVNWQKENFTPTPFSSVLRFDGTILQRGERLQTDSLSLMLFLQNKMIGYEVSVTNGTFQFPVLFDFSGEDDLFYSVYRKDSVYADVKIFLDHDTVSQVKPCRSELQYNKDFFADHLLRKRATEKSFRFFAATSSMVTGEASDPNKPFEDKLRGVDVSVKIDDYVVFPTMEDVIREIIPSLRYRKTLSGEMVRVVLYSPVVLNDPILSRGDPLYIIDGRMTRDTDYFLSLNPADLITIGVVRNISKLTPLGPIGRNGVVIIRTRKPSAILEFVDNTFLKISGLNQLLPINQRAHDNPRVPDLRYVLFAVNPNHSIANKQAIVSFKSSDQVGSYIIRLEGITEAGGYFSTWSKFSVSQP